MIKILVASHTQDTDNELKVRADYRFEKMNGVVAYSAFQPQVTKMGELIAVYKSASTKAKDLGGPPLIAAKNKAKDELKQLLRLLNSEIEVAANKLDTDEAAYTFAEGTGADIQEQKSKPRSKKTSPFLETPNNFFVENDRLHKGAAMATWDSVKGVLTYIVEEIDEAGKVLNTYNTTEKSLLIQGAASEVKKTYQMRAVGAGTSVSESTESFTVWVR